MTFKKTKLWKQKPILPHVVWVISLVLISFLGVFIIKNIDFSKIIPEKITTTTPEDSYELLSDIDPLTQKPLTASGTTEEKIVVRKKEKNKINVLLVWRGWGEHDAPNLTDTMILARLDTEKKYISFLSIPRDLYVEYPNGDNGKINGLYAKYSFKHNSKEKWMSILKRKISQITGEKIDYYLNIDFNGFVKTIDAIGWVNITVPNNFVDTQYPDGNWGYRTLIFKKGTWLFDGQNTLNYVRSRHSTSDFDRSLRQQQVIKALKEKLTAGYFLSSPKRISNLYQILKDNFFTDFWGTNIISLALKLNDSDDYKIYSANLNDSCFYWSSTCDKGWLLYVPQRDLFWGKSVLLADGNEQWNLNNYDITKKYANIVFNIPEIIEENAEIWIFNSLKVNNLAGWLYNNVKRYGFIIPPQWSIWNTDIPYEQSTIYYNNISKDSETIKLLKTFFKWQFIETTLPKYSKNNAKIEIIIWKDFLNKDNVFSF